MEKALCCPSFSSWRNEELSTKFATADMAISRGAGSYDCQRGLRFVDDANVAGSNSNATTPTSLSNNNNTFLSTTSTRNNSNLVLGHFLLVLHIILSLV